MKKLNTTLTTNCIAIVQARMGSTRLPNKMAMPFYAGKTIPALLFEQLATILPKEKIWLATSDTARDDALAATFERLGFPVFRGDENDVLSRFCTIVENNPTDFVLRICADNPFLQAEFVLPLFEKMTADAPWDYLSFEWPDGTPTIKSHLGFFAEGVRAQALLRAQEMTEDAFYHEHVTNYIYGHEEEFKCVFLPLPNWLAKRTDIRLTVDTKKDFDIAQQIYRAIKEKNITATAAEIIETIDQTPSLLSAMATEIEANAK